MAFIAGSLCGREHRNVSLSSAPMIVSGDYSYMGNATGINQSRTTETQKRKIGFHRLNWGWLPNQDTARSGLGH
jgi:hypothetical protein